MKGQARCYTYYVVRVAESDKRVAERELEVGTLSRGKYSLYLQL